MIGRLKPSPSIAKRMRWPRRRGLLLLVAPGPRIPEAGLVVLGSASGTSLDVSCRVSYGGANVILSGCVHVGRQGVHARRPPRHGRGNGAAARRKRSAVSHRQPGRGAARLGLACSCSGCCGWRNLSAPASCGTGRAIDAMGVTTDRLVPPEFTAGDWSAALSQQQDPRFLRRSPWTERTEADVSGSVQSFVVERDAQPRRRFPLAITLPDEERAMSSCGIGRKPENDWEAESSRPSVGGRDVPRPSPG